MGTLAAVVPSSPAVADVPPAGECTPTSLVNSVSMSGSSTTVRAFRTRVKVARKARPLARVQMRARVGTTQKYVATGIVDRCAGGVSSPEPVTVRFTLAHGTRVELTRSARARAPRPAIKAATKKVKVAVRARGLKANRPKIAARVNAAASAKVSALLGREAQMPAIRAAIMAEINRVRAENSLPALIHLPQLEPLADEWVEFVKDGPYAHDTDPVTGMDADTETLGCNPPLDGYPPTTSENLHWGSHGSPAEIAEWTVAWWMNSAGHRATLLNEWNIWAGIGLAWSESGEYWAVAFRATTADCSNL
ncbi:CAP domain-containing protein [Nocardioides sp. Bht2]|uniref:CAP domain-containing protein n=1 Tax=Nocardioides sp. Bht2 TaxID=3392297 RepID=UPI0039B3D65F